MSNYAAPMPEVVNIAVILTDNQRRIQWVNEEFSIITGYSLLEVVGKKPSLLQGKDTDHNVIQRIREQLSKQESVKEQITNYRKNGEAYRCNLVIHPIFNEEKELTNFIAFEIDGDYLTEDTGISLLQVDSRYKTSSLTNIEELKLFIRLSAYFEQEKPYLDPDLKLKAIADYLNTNTRYLSQVVNHQTNQNILYFINTYRIKEVKSKIIDAEYSNLTTFGVSQLCGFKNKSTFYKVFRAFTNLTPKDYIRSLKQAS